MNHLEAVSAAAEVTLDREQVERLERFHDLLVEEGIPAGALGPREGPRVWDRHVLDSLLVAAAWDGEPASDLLDVGTGAGLPGIPLAIAWPECRVTLLDRGGRRIRLLHRFVRVLGLDNVIIAQGDVFAVADHWHGMTYRASVTPPEAVGLTSKLLADDGTAVVSVSTRPEEPDRVKDLIVMAEALGLDAELRQVAPDELDHASWMLIMRRRGD